MPGKLIGRGDNEFGDIRIFSEILFDNWEITEDSSGNLDFNNNATTKLQLLSTGVDVIGNLDVTGILTAGTITFTGDLDMGTNDINNVGTINATTGTFTNVGGTLSTASQGNITSLGTLTSLTSSGNINTSANLQVDGVTIFANSTTLGSSVVNSSLTNLGTLTGLTVSAEIGADGIDVTTGNNYQINNFSVLNATTLGGGIANSSLTNVGTLTSLTISGNLTVDTNTFFVDTSANEVGIGTASPSVQLEIFDTTRPELNFDRNGTSSLNIGNNGTDAFYIAQNDDLLFQTSTSLMKFQTNGTNERMRVDTAGVDISGALTITGDTTVSNGEVIVSTRGLINSLGSLGFVLIDELDVDNLGQSFPSSQGELDTDTTTSSIFGRVIVQYAASWNGLSGSSDPRILMRFFDDGTEVNTSGDYTFLVRNFAGSQIVADNNADFIVLVGVNDSASTFYVNGTFHVDTFDRNGEVGYVGGFGQASVRNAEGTSNFGANSSFGLVQDDRVSGFTRLTAIQFIMLSGQTTGAANSFYARSWRTL